MSAFAPGQLVAGLANQTALLHSALAGALPRSAPEDERSASTRARISPHLERWIEEAAVAESAEEALRSPA